MKDRKINDRYQILETIGGGGMANVYKAHDVILNRVVAVKVLRPQFSDDDEFIRRFRREAQAATSLSHPNVVNIYDVGEEDDLYYIVMEYVEGLTLKQLIQQRGALPIEEIVDIMLQISSAISHAHANHIVHRDIKPHNILISAKGEAKVTDFGIARAMTSATITHTNSVMGSVHYLSPEQARGGLVNERSDIYSLGIVLYEMVTGEVPFSGDTAVSIAIKHLQTEVPSPRLINPSLPQSIENIILKATAKDPFHRYSQVRELEEDIQTALEPHRLNEEKFVIPKDDDDVTKAIPILKNEHSHDQDLDQTKIVKQSENKKSDTKVVKKKRKWIPILMVTILLLLGSVIAAFTIIPSLLHVDEVTIPEELVGMEYEEVFRELTALGLVVERENIPHDEIKEGRVVRHDPVAGRVVKINTTITVFVSEGKEKIEMIDVTRQNKEVARRTLIELGFKDENIFETKEATSNFNENIVISHIPQQGVLVVPEEAIIYITYSVAPTIRLDNLQGYNRDEVIEYFRKHGLSGNFDEAYSDRFPVGEVMEQNPLRGELVQKGDVIRVVFSRGPEPKPKPNPNPKPILEPELPPISTFIEFEVPISEEDQLAGLTYFVTITYDDSTTSGHVVYTNEQPINELTSFRIPVTINPEDFAEVKVAINGEEYQTHTKTYDEGAAN
ncbi:hypothetical protein BKP45_19680 [Anaerobacillus alkalidiazotrophicus]|uniref:Serine/threonine-protein kinase PrkC n=1 Tax=Anaerobacillus alkalidiazotrophicus TaxID=472963 RepID=A0A1S2LZK6_9BACI|nr:Stk1 family PASTA domain-containing Ser/Thr kinase [Anaerobacillus alkalidiazotrophicus]OIJ17786.1 hypothetical protein BKP45_19680 [Anaerobacillus alkalidiazotrophicus]